VHIDWTDLETEYRGFLRVMFITCRWTGMVFPYFMSTHGTEQENLRVVKDFVQWCHRRYNLRVKVIRSDNELNRGRTKAWIRDQGISFEASAPNTHDQNGRAERSGGVIMEKARAMRISAKLPHDMWMESVNAAVYLYNRTPRHASRWETPYKRFYTFLDQHEQASGPSDGPRKPHLAHLRAYGCRTYALTEKAQNKKGRKFKLDPRAYIRYLVGYDSTNIFRV